MPLSSRVYALLPKAIRVSRLTLVCLSGGMLLLNASLVPLARADTSTASLASLVASGSGRASADTQATTVRTAMQQDRDLSAKLRVAALDKYGPVAATLTPALASALGAPAARGGQVPGVGSLSPFPIALRLGAMVSPRTKFAGGIDITFPRIGIGPGWETRADADAIVSANLGGVSTLVPLTIDEIYSKGLIGGNRIYLGGGIGPYIGSQTRFGGKVFVGADFARHLGAEVGVHFPGSSNTLVTAQIRVSM